MMWAWISDILHEITDGDMLGLITSYGLHSYGLLRSIKPVAFICFLLRASNFLS